MTIAKSIRRRFPPLATRKDPTLAATIGTLTGGLGLAIYFRSLRDLFPVELASALVLLGSAISGVQGMLDLAIVPVMIVGGSYGRWRAQDLGERRIAACTAGSAG